MTSDSPQLIDRANQLRRSFDATFADPQSTEQTALDNFLAIRIGPDPYAMRLSDISCLVADKSFTPVPVVVPALLGITAMRGSVVAAYDMRVLLGYPGGGGRRWMALARDDTNLGLVFDGFEGHRRVSPDAIAVSEETDERSSVRQEVMRDNDIVRPIIRITSLIETISENARTRGAP